MAKLAPDTKFLARLSDGGAGTKATPPRPASAAARYSNAGQASHATSSATTPKSAVDQRTVASLEAAAAAGSTAADTDTTAAATASNDDLAAAPSAATATNPLTILASPRLSNLES